MKGSIRDGQFWFGVGKRAQLDPNLSGLASASFW